MNPESEVPLAPQAVHLDPFADDTPIVAACDLSSPESCEACQ